jgi:type II secretory pathway pseudopilin PulG
MNTRSKSGLFLIELIVVILVFSLSAATCLNLFFRSRQISIESRMLSHASMAVQSAADCYKSAAGDLKRTAELTGGELHDEGTLTLYYDAFWERVDAPASYAVVIMPLIEREGIITAEDAIGTPIFSVTVRGGLFLE